jgi:ClpP class serine protease
MNYPRIYERVYCQPLCVTRARFLSIHNVLYPRLRSGTNLEIALADPAAPPDPRPKPTVNPYNGKRKQTASPGQAWDPVKGTWVLDERLYTVPAPGIACVPVYGVLAKNLSSFEEMCGGGTDTNPIGYAIAQALAAPDIAALILDFDSPGGEVTGIPELAALIGSATKPTYGFTDASACSAAYWLMSACNECFCTQSAVIGSIGTYLAWLDETVAMQLAGLKLELFAQGDHKGMGLPGRPLTDDDRTLLQAKVDEVNGWFTSAVMDARPQVGARMADDTMEGQTFSGPEALQRGLVDGLVSDFNELVSLVSATLAAA